MIQGFKPLTPSANFPARPRHPHFVPRLAPTFSITSSNPVRIGLWASMELRYDNQLFPHSGKGLNRLNSTRSRSSIWVRRIGTMTVFRSFSRRRRSLFDISYIGRMP